ncbi:lipocalin family protein [uncultured Roseobacter sp.]|uniref:lipocalin family protein n=1 Tax=uncultured Roseobacter sp. TaxID=114847 RepID=UPI00262F3E02|nr:lipocalin family protein [uncultured Roseobacter sp.]
MMTGVGLRVGITSVLRRYCVGARRTLRARFVYLCAAGLVACAPAPETGFRDSSVPIAATTRFSPEAFSGTWQVIEAYPTPLFPGCGDQRWEARLADAAPQLVVRCGAQVRAATPVEVDPRGRLQLVSPDLDLPDRALWVLWMDEDARTAVIGTPSGEMGWILNRSADLRADRRVAAREIMAFNGYDITGLQEIGP